MREGDPGATARRAPGSPDVPLCVDLDGTLIRGDMLAESVVRLLRERPASLMMLPVWLASGRARLKERIAGLVRVDPASLPYNPELLEHVREQRALGRRTILVTASHAAPARDVADHLGLFDEVIATEDGRNLKGRTKRAELVERYGERGFDYAGNSSADLEVWPAAREAIVVNAPASVERRVGERASTVLDRPARSAIGRVPKAIRVHQWVKNLLLFLPLLLAHRYLQTTPLFMAFLGFASFSLGASAVYVLNDLLDVEADRHHPIKRNRPFASGEIPLLGGMLLAPVLVAASLTAAWFLPPRFFMVLLGYFLVTTLYSLVLKEIAIVDVMVLASLYTLRIYAGSAATGVPVSEWLLAFSMFIFLSLGAVKRYAELRRIRDTDGLGDTKVRGRGYFAGDLELVVQMGLASGYIAVLVLALYINSEAVRVLYHRPDILWLVCPLLLFWISRIWLLAHRGQMQEDPLTFAVTDRVTWIVAALSTAVIVAGGLVP